MNEVRLQFFDSHKNDKSDSHANFITVRICHYCPDRLRRAGLTVFGKPAPRDLGGNNFGIFFDRFGLPAARTAAVC